MGRAKLRMELIGKEKSRNITFKKRKEGLIRKLHEFTTLCDVSACMVIYGPRQEKGAVEPEIWPRNMDEINRIIGIYRAKNKDSGNKTYCLSDFFHDRKRKIEDELAKLRKKNMESKYPTWLDLLNFITEAQLREFSASLRNKAQYVKSRIEFLRRKKQGFGIELGMMNHDQQGISSSVRPIHYPNIDHHQDLHSINQNNSMMMLLMNENDQFLQFGAASNVHSSLFKRQVFYESMISGCGVGDPMMYHSPNPLAQYYVPPPPHLPLNMMPAVVLPQVQLRENQDVGQEDIVLYQMKDQKAKF